MKFLWVVAIGFALVAGGAAQAQREGGVSTQVLVNVDAKATAPASASALTVSVEGRKEPLSAWAPVVPAEAQVALLIDDGLRESVGRELSNLRDFIQGLPPGVEILVGYMQNGRVVQTQPFTANHASAAATLRLPDGVPGLSASPYFCLSDFVKKWPGAHAAVEPNAVAAIGGDVAATGLRKARFVLMITNGVDPYNDSTSLTNEDSPYVRTAIADAQRAGVAVYAIYFANAGIGGPSASLSGQSYLQQVAEATGGTSYFEGNGSPVSMAPFLKSFRGAIADTYIATFDVPLGKDAGRGLVRVKLSSDVKTKLHAPTEVRPGNVE